MPGSNKTERNRALKANRAAGIGDEMGRIVRVKDPGVILICTVCKAELKCTKVGFFNICNAFTFLCNVNSM